MRRVGDGEGNVVTSADAGCFMDLICRARCRGEIGSILLFSFIFVGLSFFSRSLDVGSRGTGNGAQVRDWMIDDGFRRIYGYFVLRRERILSPAREEETRNTWLPFATSFLKFTIRE